MVMTAEPQIDEKNPQVTELLVREDFANKYSSINSLEQLKNGANLLVKIIINDAKILLEKVGIVDKPLNTLLTSLKNTLNDFSKKLVGNFEDQDKLRVAANTMFEIYTRGETPSIKPSRKEFIREMIRRLYNIDIFQVTEQNI